MRLSQRHLEYALKRIEDFHAVHSTKSPQQLIEPLNVLLESVGLGTDVTDQLNAWLADWGGSEVDDSLLLGMLIALIASDCDG